MITNIVEREFVRSVLAELKIEERFIPKIVDYYFAQEYTSINNVMNSKYNELDIFFFKADLVESIEYYIRYSLYTDNLKAVVNTINQRSIEWHGLDLTPEDLMAY